MGPTHKIKEDWGRTQGLKLPVRLTLIPHGTSLTSDVVEDPDFQDSLPNQSGIHPFLNTYRPAPVSTLGIHRRTNRAGIRQPSPTISDFIHSIGQDKETSFTLEHYVHLGLRERLTDRSPVTKSLFLERP